MSHAYGFGPNQLVNTVYKLLTKGEWQALSQGLDWLGSAHDQRDGFIHLSARHQIARTLSKFFAAEPVLTLAAVPLRTLGAELKWEAASDGTHFPHLYRPLRVSDVSAHWTLQKAADGSHPLPGELPQ